MKNFIKIVLENIIKVYIKIIKIFISKTFILLILLLIALDSFPIIPKLYFFVHNYNFSYDKTSDKTRCFDDSFDCICIDSIKWEGNDFIVTGIYNWSYGGVSMTSPDLLHGAYRVNDDIIYLYVQESNSQFGSMGLTKFAKALVVDETADFKFIVKNLPRKDYKVVLNGLKNNQVCK